jgi:L-cysteine:1D-myo-inositol 2-amino-2-deoxy-alpha-D-glucopyranoside ligase
MAIRAALLSGHWCADRAWRPELLDEATARLARWREAVGLPAGPDAADTVARLRQHLADDLDTPRALAAVDAWAADALTRRGRDEAAPRLVGAAVDALLGIAL